MAGPGIPIQPKSGPVTSVSYRQKLSWEIREEDWNKDRELSLQLRSCISGAYQPPEPSVPGWTEPYPGGFIAINNKGIIFATDWPKDADLDNIHVQAAFSLKTNDGKCSVAVKNGQKKTSSSAINYNSVYLKRLVKINPEHLYDESRSFTFEADLVVEMNDAKDVSFEKSDSFVKEIKSILHDEKNSDFLVVAEDKKFKCHKNILSARSELFKNALAHNTLESNTNTIVIKEIPAKAVGDMLKHIYSGELPDDPKSLTTDLLQIADMHQLHSLKEACVKNLMESLDVSSCISTFILLDRFLPHNGNLREMVITFMQCKAVEVVEMEDCDKLVDTHPALAKELMRAITRGRDDHKCQFCILSYK